jgi:uncharacterized protein YdhG (YjbR/CyaY superfamily)
MRRMDLSLDTIDQYIASAPELARPRLRELRATIQRAAPEAVEAIKYGIPTFVLGKSLVHFAAFAHHIGFYPAPSGITAFQRELAAYHTAKGSVQFPYDEPLPLRLVAKIVAYRRRENLEGLQPGRAASRRPATKRKATAPRKVARAKRKAR